MLDLREDTILKRNTDILANYIGNETVMMSMIDAKYFGINKTGSYIWKQLESPITIIDLCKKITSEFEVSETQCLQEIKPFIEEMTKENIIFVQ